MAVEACRRLILDAVAYTDGGDTEALAALFTDDAVLVRPGGTEIRGRAAIQQVYASRPADRITRHLVSNTRVDLLSDIEARATSFVLLWAGSKSDPEGLQGRLARQAGVVGEFDDRIRFEAQGWRIFRREARFVLHMKSTDS